MSLKTQTPILASDNLTELQALLTRYGMQLRSVADQQAIPGSFWGDSEAGLLGSQLLIRSDTPMHSALHEACHYVCMDEQRRSQLNTCAGGDYDEENAVCYLQILLADQLSHFGKQRAFTDMDNWGYSFRLGSTQRWFEEDSEDARDWLIQHHIIDTHQQPTFKLRLE